MHLIVCQLVLVCFIVHILYVCLVLYKIRLFIFVDQFSKLFFIYLNCFFKLWISVFKL